MRWLRLKSAQDEAMTAFFEMVETMLIERMGEFKHFCSDLTHKQSGIKLWIGSYGVQLQCEGKEIKLSKHWKARLRRAMEVGLAKTAVEKCAGVPA